MKIVEASFILQAADDIEKDVHSSNSVYSDKVLNVKDVPYVLRSLVRHGGIDVDVEPEKPRAKCHPIKTRQSEFLKMFPNAPFYRGVVSIPPCSVEKEMRENCLRSDCYECRRTYWLAEVTNND